MAWAPGDRMPNHAPHELLDRANISHIQRSRTIISSCPHLQVQPVLVLLPDGASHCVRARVNDAASLCADSKPRAACRAPAGLEREPGAFRVTTGSEQRLLRAMQRGHIDCTNLAILVQSSRSFPISRRNSGACGQVCMHNCGYSIGREWCSCRTDHAGSDHRPASRRMLFG